MIKKSGLRTIKMSGLRTRTSIVFFLPNWCKRKPDQDFEKAYFEFLTLLS